MKTKEKFACDCVLTSRLSLRPLKISDAPQVFKWCGDETVTKYMSYTTYSDLSSVEKWIASVSGDEVLGIINSSELIGSVGYVSNGGGAIR